MVVIKANRNVYTAQVMCNSRNNLCYAGSLINLNGAFLTVGFQAIRVFDPVAKNYSVVGYTDRARFDPTLVTLGDGNMLVLGGTQQVSGQFLYKLKMTDFSV